MSLLDQLRAWFQRRGKDPTQILDPSGGFYEHPGRHRDRYLTSEHFRDLADENDDAGDDKEGHE